MSEAAHGTQDFIARLFAPEDESLQRILHAMEKEGLPEIQLPAITGRTVQLLLRMIGARSVLEIGTLAGYSALWIVRALPARGRLVTVDSEPERSRLARRLLEEAGEGGQVEFRTGDAASVFSSMESDGSWDAVFLDADKEGLPGYVAHARRLLRPGGLLLVDNALWKGKVVDPENDEASTRAIRTTLETVARDPEWDALLLPVGDGLLVARRL